jgi:hypothetical protein
MRNYLPPAPSRTCEKKMGLPLSMRIAKAVHKMIGASAANANAPIVKSSMRRTEI